MKVKIRRYEYWLVGLLGLMTVVNYVLQSFHLSPMHDQGFIQYNKMHREDPFDYERYLILPRLAVVALLLAAYYWINLFTLPQLRRTGYRSFFIYPWVVVQGLLLAGMLATGVNAATYYAHPAWNNYGDFKLFALLGYNEHPLTDLRAGFDRALILLLVYVVYAAIREYVIYKLENSGDPGRYRVLIINQLGASFCIFLLIPYLTSSLEIISDDGLYRDYFLFVPTIILVYFSNTYWLFPRYSISQGISIRLIWRLALSTFLYSIPFALLFAHAGVTPYMLFLNWTLQLAVVNPITWMLYQQRRDKINELRGAEMALSRSTADLQFLRSQINPHFLFNVLNTIYATALMDGSKRTANAIQKLGDMMRFMLDDNHLDFIPLNNEISYLQNYIALQKLRFQDSEQMEISENFRVDGGSQQIIPMLLIPFVENAFKHGIDIHKKSWIKINLSGDEQNICFRVSNSLHLEERNDPERRHSGIGLKNVKERLEIFYPGRHELGYTTTENEFMVELNIKLTAGQS